MRSHTITLAATLANLALVFTICGASLPAIAADSKTQCQVNEAARDALNKAKVLVTRADTVNKEAVMLLEKAKKASRPPNCDSARARKLANKASQLAKTTRKSTGVKHAKHTKSSNTEKKHTGTLSGCGETIEFEGDGSKDDTVLNMMSTSTTTTTYALGSTSGTFDCDTGFGSIDMQQYQFVAATRGDLARDIARGGGEYVTTMAYLEGCPSETHESFVKMAKRNYDRIFTQLELEPKMILLNLENQITADPLLAAQCSEVSI